MSLLIDPRKVTEVLLADGWHRVKPGSFDVDAYEYGFHYESDGDIKYSMSLEGGQCSLVPSTGFSFIDIRADDDRRTSGPLTSIIAVNHKPIEDE